MAEQQTGIDNHKKYEYKSNIKRLIGIETVRRK